MNALVVRRFRSFGVLSGLIIGLVTAADFFFYDHPVGWTVGFYLLLFAGAVVLRAGMKRRSRVENAVALGVVGVAFFAIEQPSPLVMLFAVLGLGSLAMIGRGGWTSSLADWAFRWFRFALVGWFQPFIDIGLAWRRRARTRTRKSVVARFVALWGIPIALSLVFVFLFAVANPLISRAIDGAREWLAELLENLPRLISPPRVVFWAMVGWIVWSTLRVRFALRPPKDPASVFPKGADSKAGSALRPTTDKIVSSRQPRSAGDPATLEEADIETTDNPGIAYSMDHSEGVDPTWADQFVDPVEPPEPAVATPAPVAAPQPKPAGEAFPGTALVLRCLILFNAVFAVQSVLDAVYLFNGTRVPKGMTYTEYAHRGAYPLVFTALLAAFFVLITFRNNGPAQRSPAARKLVYLWLAQNVFLVFGAAWRLGLYVNLGGLTRLRVAAMIWMGLVALGLALIVYRIVRNRSNAWLIRANTLAALLTLYACAPLNIDGFIAMFNAKHCREVVGNARGPLGLPGTRTFAIDMRYLRHLGQEALPALELLAERATDEQVRRVAQKDADLVRADLKEQLADWRGWTWRRARLSGTSEVRSAGSAKPQAGLAARG